MEVIDRKTTRCPFNIMFLQRILKRLILTSIKSLCLEKEKTND